VDKRDFEVSIEAKECIGQMLEETEGKKYKCSDLQIALYCFNLEKKTSIYYKRMVHIEEALKNEIEDMGIQEVLRLMHSYVLCRRVYPPTLMGINKAIEKHIGT
jgi:Ca2+-binding EF-hand superfamily protein